MSTNTSASLRLHDSGHMRRSSSNYNSRRSTNRKRGGSKSFQRAVIRAADLVISLCAIVLLLPVFALISTLIYLEDRGPVFFVQPRVGKNGAYFKCLKFRSMLLNGEEAFKAYLDSHPTEAKNWSIYHKLDNDPRITTIGRFIRKTSLDEFPQLINVLKGEMSLVGPRPIVEGEIKKYGASIRLYKSVLPGITGLWQVKGRNSLTYRQRVALDRVFAGKAGIFLYVQILVMTVPAVIFQKGSR